MARPALAIVIVSYDSGEDLPATLEAVTAQLEPGDELVVVDNASSDESPAIARTIAPAARVVELQRNAGFAGGCHAGVAASMAPLLLFLNPDVRVAPGCLARLRAAASEHPQWGAWQPMVLLPGGNEVNTSGGVVHWIGAGWAGECGTSAGELDVPPRAVGFASGAAMVVRRTAWAALGGFDAAYFMYGEDVDLSMRLRLAGWECGVIPAAQVEHDYEFAKGDYKWFLLERNRWWTVLGAYPGALLALVLPGLVAADLALLVVAARSGWLRAKLRAQAAVLRSLPWALARRRRVQATRQVSARHFGAFLSASLDSPFVGVTAASHADLAQASYWALVGRALGAIGDRARHEV